MARGRRGLCLLTVGGLLLGACGGDDSSPTGSGGSSAAGGTDGTGGSAATGGTGGSSGGAGGAGGEAGSGGASGSGGTSNPDAGPASDGASDAPGNIDGAGDGGGCLPAGSINVVNDGSAGYLFDNGPLNPVLTLCRGNKYTFVVNAPGHPIYIRQTGETFTNGVTGNFISMGDLVFDVPRDAPGMLFYQCDIHEVMTGVILIVD